MSVELIVCNFGVFVVGFSYNNKEYREKHPEAPHLELFLGVLVMRFFIGNED